MREARLILRDLRGTRFRSAAVVISVALLVALLFSTSVLEVSSRRASQTGSEKFGADLMIMAPLAPSTFSYETATGPIFVVTRPEGFMNGGIREGFLGLPGIEAASPQLFVGLLNGSVAGQSTKLVGFDPGTDFVIRAWSDNSLTTLQDDEAVAGPGTRYSVGDDVLFGALVLRVVAVLEPTNSTLDRTVLFPIQAAYSLPAFGNESLPPNPISALMLKLTSEAIPSTVESEVKNGPGNFRVVEASGLVSRVRVDTTGIASYQLLAEIIMGGSVFILMTLVFSMTTNERSRQLGVLRSVGATRRFIFTNVVKEVALMAAVGSAIGLVIGELVVGFGYGYLFATFNTSLISPDFWESLVLILRSVALGVITGTAASVAPAYRVVRRDPYEAIRKGE